MSSGTEKMSIESKNINGEQIMVIATAERLSGLREFWGIKTLKAIL